MLTILLIVINQLFSCSLTKNVANPEPIKTKNILGVFDLDSLSQSKNYLRINKSMISIILNRRHRLYFQVPYKGDNGFNAKLYRKGIWKSSSDTLFLTFGLKDDKNIIEEVYIFRADSIIPIDTANHKNWIKRK